MSYQVLSGVVVQDNRVCDLCGEWATSHPGRDGSRLCKSHREQRRKNYHKNYERNKQSSLRQQVQLRENTLSRYGLTIFEYDELLRLQNFVCAICLRPESRTNYGGLKRLAVDHCHETYAVRGLLCGGCNTAIGLIGESLEVLENMRTYLERSIRIKQAYYNPLDFMPEPELE